MAAILGGLVARREFRENSPLLNFRTASIFDAWSPSAHDRPI